MTMLKSARQNDRRRATIQVWWLKKDARKEKEWNINDRFLLLCCCCHPRFRMCFGWCWKSVVQSHSATSTICLHAKQCCIKYMHACEMCMHENEATTPPASTVHIWANRLQRRTKKKTEKVPCTLHVRFSFSFVYASIDGINPKKSSLPISATNFKRRKKITHATEDDCVFVAKWKNSTHSHWIRETIRASDNIRNAHTHMHIYIHTQEKNKDSAPSGSGEHSLMVKLHPCSSGVVAVLRRGWSVCVRARM